MKVNGRNRLGIALLAMIALAAPGLAQEKTGPIATPPRNETRQETTTSQAQKIAQPQAATLVTLDVLVTDEDGVVLGGLKQADFRVLDNGKEQAITHFEPVGAPITIVMLLESSASSYDYFAYKSASWGSALLNYLEPQDYVALVTYDIRPTVRVDFTRNKAEVQQALAASSYGQFHESNLYDAVIDTLDRLDHVKGKKAVLIVGTGANTMSQYNLNDTLSRIKESDVTLFAVGVAEAEYESAGGTSIAYLHSKNIMETFAKLTGGMAWFPRFQGEIPGIFRSVATHLRSQYRIGFSPTSSTQDGKYHKLKVEILGADGKPLVVTNPKGKRRKTVVYAREGYVARGGDVRK